MTIHTESQKNCYVQQRINEVGLGHIYASHREFDRSKMVAELPDEHHRLASRKVWRYG
jgi:hypothetical protein